MAIRPGDPAFAFSGFGIMLNAPNASGVYALCDAQGTYVYFGESNDIQRRLQEHLSDPTPQLKRAAPTMFAFELVEHAFLRVLRQNELIAAYPTPCNQRMG